MLLENPSSYFQFSESSYSEPAFLNAVVAQTGCGLLLDVNNIFISCHNLNISAEAYLNELNCAAVGEIHLSGHSTDLLEQSEDLLIDSHAAPAADPVWRLYENILRLTGPQASLIEWDTNVPECSVLYGEVMQAACLLEQQICKWNSKYARIIDTKRAFYSLFKPRSALPRAFKIRQPSVYSQGRSAVSCKRKLYS